MSSLSLAKDLNKQHEKLFWGMSLITILSVLTAVLSYSIFPILIPFALLGLYLTIVDIRLVFFGLVSILAFSTEIDLPGGFGTDLPGEPLMILITGIYFLQIFTKPEKAIIPLRRPITILILLHVAWIGLTVITSENITVSLKFFLAKIWYVIPFYFAPFIFLKEKKHIKKLIYMLVGSVSLAAFYVMVKHYSLGLSFDTIEKAVQPIFRNHVNYACLLVVVISYVWLVFQWNRTKLFPFIFILGINLLILSAIYFSFTRAAILSVVIGIGALFVLRLKLTRLSFMVSILAASMFVVFMIRDAKYLEYAPNFEKTISHNEFDNLLEATAKGEDISTMERVYRWVAGFQMLAERPITGYGANNFYPYYKNKTISSFETYVSHNPEKSGIHCYYLMTAVEQGVPGLIIFILLCFYILYEAEKVYHLHKDPFYKQLTAAAYISVIIILSILIVNDLLEADKVGPFFFLAAAFIVISRRNIPKSVVKD